VTVTHLPVTRCQICHHTIAYRPGKASDALTGHYRQAHPGTPRLPLLPVASHTQTARRPQRPCPAGVSRPGRTAPQTPGGHRPWPAHGKGTRDTRPGAARRLAAAINRGVHIRSIWCTRSTPGRAGKHQDLADDHMPIDRILVNSPRRPDPAASDIRRVDPRLITCESLEFKTRCPASSR
jgi:hypothetical protein